MISNNPVGVSTLTSIMEKRIINIEPKKKRIAIRKKKIVIDGEKKETKHISKHELYPRHRGND